MYCPLYTPSAAMNSCLSVAYRTVWRKCTCAARRQGAGQAGGLSKQGARRCTTQPTGGWPVWGLAGRVGCAAAAAVGRALGWTRRGPPPAAASAVLPFRAAPRCTAGWACPPLALAPRSIRSILCAPRRPASSLHQCAPLCRRTTSPGGTGTLRRLHGWHAPAPGERRGRGRAGPRSPRP